MTLITAINLRLQAVKPSQNLRDWGKAVLACVGMVLLPRLVLATTLPFVPFLCSIATDISGPIAVGMAIILIVAGGAVDRVWGAIII